MPPKAQPKVAPVVPPEVQSAAPEAVPEVSFKSGVTHEMTLENGHKFTRRDH